MNIHHFSVLSLAALLAFAAACAKKEPPKPVHTEPWLAHPPASAAATSDAALPLWRYTLGAQSQVHFEVPRKQGALRGSFSHVSGELSLDPSDLARGRGHIEVDLNSLSVSVDGEADEAALLARVKNALGASAAEGNVNAIFDLTSLEDVSPAQLDPVPDTEGGTSVVRRARATAVGDLLLHGFRVSRRVPLAADFSFTLDRHVPTSVVIRSRTPFTISLATHEIHVTDTESQPQPHKTALNRVREARVSIELYGAKAD